MKMKTALTGRADQNLKELNLLKQNLLLELQNYDAAGRTVKADDVTSTQKMEKAAIPVSRIN